MISSSIWHEAARHNLLTCCRRALSTQRGWTRRTSRAASCTHHAPSRAGRCTMRDWSRRRKLSERTFDAQWCARARARDGQPGRARASWNGNPRAARIMIDRSSSRRASRVGRAAAASRFSTRFSASCPKSPAIILKRLNISESAPGTHYKRPRSARADTSRPRTPNRLRRRVRVGTEGCLSLWRALSPSASARPRVFEARTPPSPLPRLTFPRVIWIEIRGTRGAASPRRQRLCRRR